MSTPIQAPQPRPFDAEIRDVAADQVLVVAAPEASRFDALYAESSTGVASAPFEILWTLPIPGFSTAFSGGASTDAATDFTTAEGDTTDGTIP